MRRNAGDRDLCSDYFQSVFSLSVFSFSNTSRNDFSAWPSFPTNAGLYQIRAYRDCKKQWVSSSVFASRVSLLSNGWLPPIVGAAWKRRLLFFTSIAKEELYANDGTAYTEKDCQGSSFTAIMPGVIMCLQSEDYCSTKELVLNRHTCFAITITNTGSRDR